MSNLAPVNRDHAPAQALPHLQDQVHPGHRRAHDRTRVLARAVLAASSVDQLDCAQPLRARLPARAVRLLLLLHAVLRLHRSARYPHPPVHGRLSCLPHRHCRYRLSGPAAHLHHHDGGGVRSTSYNLPA